MFILHIRIPTFAQKSTPGQRDGVLGTALTCKYLSSEVFLRKSEESRTPKIGHFRGGLLSSLLAKSPSYWLYCENLVTLVTRKVHLAKSGESRPP